MLLGDRGIEQTRLILLTRYPEHYRAEDARPDLEIRWFEFADWLESELPAVATYDVVAGFLTRQFLEFLRCRNMTLTQVSKYMPEGMRAISSLLNMLSEAAAAQKISVRLSTGWDYLGLTLDGLKYWIGIYFSEPEKLWFGTRCRIDSEAATQLGVGELHEESWVPGRNRWWRSVELDSEPVHFFSRSKIGQMEYLESFLRESIAMAKSIETLEQPPIPDETEGA